MNKEVSGVDKHLVRLYQEGAARREKAMMREHKDSTWYNEGWMDACEQVHKYITGENIIDE